MWVVVAVCIFTRWVEVGILANLTSADVAEWFHREIVCRYGLPVAVRSDKGTEYRGAFDDYLKANAIQHRVISTMNPRANGMVERFNRTIKAGIRKLLGMSPDLRWWEVIPDVVRGMRVIA